MASIPARTAQRVARNMPKARSEPAKEKVASQNYIAHTEIPSVTCTERQRQLIILDLNGTLVSKTGKAGMWVRPHYQDFLSYLFRNFEVCVWSSARQKTVKNMCQLFGDHKKQLSFIWSRENMGLTKEEYFSNISTVKDLQLVWKHYSKQAGSNIYNANNTILLDDSITKAILQPCNSIEIGTFNHKLSTTKINGDSELLDVINYLEKVQYQSNISNFFKEHPYETKPTYTAHDTNFQFTYYRFNSDYVMTEDSRKMS
ncbi:hypothetical protein INT43_009028 [Umbelopsis isabellina]|uniref:Mitochondrial import inner membrane translocase subunit TIM50 n=1 Tax=Mortierella isabellina TaxID=91625 RepID=A0A8H7U815_MORIS|nr:hypothetical protein INT43_009028 [Umbelopsis isabellina]